jgi:hypothetical protein
LEREAIMSEGKQSESHLTREQILAALESLNRGLAERGIMGEVCLFGGAVMVLAFKARLATKDVDAVFEPASIVRELARQVAESAGLPANWLNDGVKGYLSARHEKITPGSLPQFDHLRVLMPTAEYLLAMKCLASRIGIGAGEADDTSDIAFLIRRLGLKNPGSVMDIVAAYPPEQIPVKAQFLVETLFEEGRV